MPDFQNPVAFLLLLLIPILYIFRKFGIFTRPSFVVTLSDWNGKSFPWYRPARRFASLFSKILGILGFVVAVIAFSEPVFYKQERVYTSRGTDVVFVVDVSPSMAAKDMGGLTRLEIAKNSIKELVGANSGATFGVVAMAKEAAIVIPPTIYTKVLLERLESLSVGQLGDGTALGTGISTAVFHLSSSQAPKKCIVLITDGESNAGSIHPETAAELAKNNNITVYVMGVGTKGTVPIEYTDPLTGKIYSGYLNSSYSEDYLRQIAITGNGRFFEVKSLSDFKLALSMIIKNQSVIQTYHSKTTTYDYYDRLILTSGILFVLSWIIRRIFLREAI